MKYAILFFYLICNIANAQRSDFDHIDFSRADNLASLNKGASLNNLPLLTYKLTSKLPTEVEKFRAIYFWICDNIKGDPNQHDLVASKRRDFRNDAQAFKQWNTYYNKIAIEKLLRKKKTMCSGYTYLLQQMCILANLECEIVDGYIRTIESNVFELDNLNHSWNAVKINNKWYLCDPTWSSGYMKGGVQFIKEYNNGYFLASPELFSQSHYPINKKWLLSEDLISSKFIAGPLVYEETFKQNIIPKLPAEMRTTILKNSVMHFKFEVHEDIPLKQIALIKKFKKNEKVLSIFNLNRDGNMISFDYKLTQKGLHDLHLRIRNDIVATYTVKVTNNVN